MDDLDHKNRTTFIRKCTRMPVKDIAQKVSLIQLAVSSRIHRLEQEGIIGGYTAVLRNPGALPPVWRRSSRFCGCRHPRQLRR